MKKPRMSLVLLIVVALVVSGLPPQLVIPPTISGAGVGAGFWRDLRGLLAGGNAGTTPHSAPAVDLGHRTADGLPMRQGTPTGGTAAEPGRVRELTERRTTSAKFFELTDGRVQAEVSTSPVHYRDGTGAWREIDTRVAATGRPGYVLGNETNRFTSLFGDTSDRLVRFELGGRYVALGVAGAAHAITPTVAGSTVTYPEVLGGADLVYRVGAETLKEEIVLPAVPAVADPSYTFVLQLGGVQAYPRQDGSVAFVRDGAGEGARPLFVMPKPFMTDAKDDPSSPYRKAFSDNVTQTVTQQGSRIEVTVRPDRAWLASADRVYPVVIDPTITVEPTPTEGQDAMIRSGGTRPTTNYGAGWQLSVGTDPTGVARSLLKFDLSWLPAGTALDSAVLKMWYDQGFYTNANAVAVSAYRIGANWDESLVTWGNFTGATTERGYNQERVDNTDTGKVAVNGSWPSASLTTAVNGSYQYNKNATTGESFTWVPRLTESGTYQVDASYIAYTDRSTAAPYTIYYSGGTQTVPVNQSTGGPWTTLTSQPFTAGTSHKVVLGDVTDSTKAVVADAVRFTKWATVTKAAKTNSVWHNFSVRSLAQGWVNNPATNYGVMLRAADESVLGRGGQDYEAAEYAYNGGTANRPKLVVTYPRTGVNLDPITTIYSTGAKLGWPGYADPSTATGDDLVEYQVHRSIYQVFTPSAATLVAPLAPGTTTFVDTTAQPTPASDPDPFGNAYYYMVAVKTKDGTLVPATTRLARLPKAGRVTQIIQGTAQDTTLSNAGQSTNYNLFDEEPWLGVGDNGLSFGVTRAPVKFPDINAIPAGVTVVDAELKLWKPMTFGSGAVYDLHELTRDFDQTTATWLKANATTAWTKPGGDYTATRTDYVPTVSADPKWHIWNVGPLVQKWRNTAGSNHGVLIKAQNETLANQLTVFDSNELGSEPQLRPQLWVSYLEKTNESTYYAPYTPSRMIPGNQYTVSVTLTNTTAAQWNTADYVLSYKWTLPDGSTPTGVGASLQTALPRNMPPGDTAEVNATLKTPIQSDAGNKRSAFVLSWDLYNKTTGTWLSAMSGGVPALPQNVTVEDPTSDQLGLEKFYAYAGDNTGAGSTMMTNLFAGNTVWSYNAFANPSRGAATFVRLSYNSKDTSTSPAGFGWSVSGSTVHRLGSPLDFHPNPNPTRVALTDGDGTSLFWLP